MSELAGKLVFVSGSTKGIGKAIAQALLDKQARVVVHGRSEQSATAVKSEINAFGQVTGDISTVEGSQSVLSQLAQIGEVEVLVNNVGIFGVEDFFEASDESWLNYYQTNVMSCVRMCRGLMPAMLKANSGRVINLSSESAYKPLPQMIHYSMTKTALVSVSRGLAEVTKGSGVTVNALLPGPTWTEGVDTYFEGLAKEEGKPAQELIDNYFAEHEPTSLIQRFVDVREVAHAVVFLAANGAVNGSALRVEGGIIRSI